MWMLTSLTTQQNHALLATFFAVQTKHESKYTQEYKWRLNVIYIMKLLPCVPQQALTQLTQLNEDLWTQV